MLIQCTGCCQLSFNSKEGKENLLLNLSKTVNSTADFVVWSIKLHLYTDAICSLIPARSVEQSFGLLGYLKLFRKVKLKIFVSVSKSGGFEHVK